MAQPRTYTQTTTFTDHSTVSPADPHSGADLDVEFVEVKQTLDDLNTNIALLQRDDGKLSNQVVHKDSFDQDALALVGATGSGFNSRGDWATATAYVAGDLVTNNAATYLATAASHTSGATFAGDSAAQWQLIANSAIETTSASINMHNGTGSQTLFTTLYTYTNVGDIQVFVNGALQATTAYSITNSGGANNITITSPPPSGTNNVIIWGATVVAEAAKQGAKDFRDTAGTHATASAASATASAADLVLTNADVVLTHADVVLTHADELLTRADTVATAADKVATNADVVLTNADVVLAEADKVQTGLDRVATAADKVATNADVVLTAADELLTRADTVLTAADVVSTNADVVLTHADELLTRADTVLTAADVVSAEADKVQTGLDRIAVAADLVATNQDTIDTAADVVLAEADKVQTGLDRVATAADKVATNADVVLTTADELLTRADTVLTAADVVSTNADVVTSTASEVAARASAAAVSQTFDNFADVYLGSMADGATADTGTLTGASWAVDSSSIAFTGTTGTISLGQELTSTGSGYPVGANIIGSSVSTPLVISNPFTASGTGATLNFVGSGVYGAFNVTKDGPATDNDGDALADGMLYFNTSDNTMKIYKETGAEWIAATSAGSTSLLIYKYIATAAQTSFTGSDANGATLTYTVNNINVFLNGVRLDASDYTATSGTSIVLGSGAALSDELIVTAYKSFTVADMVPASTGGTFTGAVTASGGVVGNLTGNASGTAATVTTAAQPAITSVGTLTTLTVDNVIVNGTTIGHTSDTDLLTLTSGNLAVAGDLETSTTGKIKQKGAFMQSSTHQALTLGG
jgi:hypothetical protein